jgi:hypothetical protein
VPCALYPQLTSLIIIFYYLCSLKIKT